MYHHVGQLLSNALLPCLPAMQESTHCNPLEIPGPAMRGAVPSILLITHIQVKVIAIPHSVKRYLALSMQAALV